MKYINIETKEEVSVIKYTKINKSLLNFLGLSEDNINIILSNKKEKSFDFREDNVFYEEQCSLNIPLNSYLLKTKDNEISIISENDLNNIFIKK